MGIGMDLRLGLDLRPMFGFRVESRTKTRSGIEAWLLSSSFHHFWWVESYNKEMVLLGAV